MRLGENSNYFQQRSRNLPLRKVEHRLHEPRRPTAGRLCGPTEFNRLSAENSSLYNVWMESQKLMTKFEQVAYYITHVCTNKLTGVFRTQDLKCQCRGPCDQSHANFYDDLRLCCSRTGDVDGPVPSSPEVESLSSSCCVSSASMPHSFTGEFYQRTTYPANDQDDGRVKGGPPLPTVKRKDSRVINRGWPSVAGSDFVFIVVLLLVVSIADIADCCSSRTTPRIHPTLPTSRPDITFQQYACPPMYAALLCLNGGTCFSVKIVNSMMYNCECADGFVGARCELKAVSHNYNSRVIMETASIAGGACFAIVLVFSILATLYVYVNKRKQRRRLLDDPYHDGKPLSSNEEVSSSDYSCQINTLSIQSSSTPDLLQGVKVLDSKRVSPDVEQPEYPSKEEKNGLYQAPFDSLNPIRLPVDFHWVPCSSDPRSNPSMDPNFDKKYTKNSNFDVKNLSKKFNFDSVKIVPRDSSFDDDFIGMEGSGKDSGPRCPDHLGTDANTS